MKLPQFTLRDLFVLTLLIAAVVGLFVALCEYNETKGNKPVVFMLGPLGFYAIICVAVSIWRKRPSTQAAAIYLLSATGFCVVLAKFLGLK